MRLRQRGACAICLRELPPTPSVDHDHELAALHGHDPRRGCAMCARGLLCQRCNLLLGHAGPRGDDELVLLRALAYLREWRSALRARSRRP